MHYFVIGDIHGCYKQLEKILTYWNPEKERLVFLGDYIDRGPDSKRVLEKVMGLHKTHEAIVLSGNHEEMLLNFIEDPIGEFPVFFHNGGQETLESFGLLGSDPDFFADAFLKKHASVLKFLKEDTLDYYETPDFVFVHAGVDPHIDNWRESGENFKWIRTSFHISPNPTGKTVVFGHTPTEYLNKDGSSHIWSTDNKIGIDGGCVFGGQLHALRLTEKIGVTDIISIGLEKRS